MTGNDLAGDVIREQLDGIEKRIDSLIEKIHERADRLESVRNELAVWRGRIEGLKLQASLGRMDFDDRLRPSIEHLEASYEKARRYLKDLSKDELSWDEIEPELSASMAELRREFDMAGTGFGITRD